MSISGVSERSSLSPAVNQEDDESYFSLTGQGLDGSIVVAPSSLPEYLERSLKPTSTIDIPIKGRVVQIKKVFVADAERADEPQNLSINGIIQAKVEDQKDLWNLVGRVEEAVGADRLHEATEIASQRPGIVLRKVVQEEFQRQFGYDPIFDARGVMDSSVNLIANSDACQSETHLTGLIRNVMDPDSLEPSSLKHPIIYDATAEFDLVHQTIEYNIGFHINDPAPPKKKRFCTIL